MPFNSFEQYPMSWKPQWNREKPLYLSLSRCLEEDIQAGRLLPGTKLPPQRELADFLDVNVSTVSRAFRLCADKGVLTSMTGSGTFVAHDVMTNLSVAPQDGGALIELGSMMPEQLPAGPAADLVTDMMGEDQAASLFQYSSGGREGPRAAAALLLQHLGVTCSAGQIAEAGGGQNAIAALLASLCRRGDRIGTDPLVYPGLKQAAKLLGIRLVPVGGADGEMSAEGVAYAVQNHQIKGLYVVPDFHNPTGRVMSETGRRALARAAADAGLFIIEDGITRPMASQPLPPVQAFAPERTFFILSLSKAVWPALRTAYIVCPEASLDRVEQALAALNLSPSALLQELSSRLIVSGLWEAIAGYRRRGVMMRNKLAGKILAGYDLEGSEESLCRWLVLPPGWTGRQAEEAARSGGVSVYGTDHFAVGTGPHRQGLRLAVTAPEDLEELAEGLIRLKAILDAGTPG